MGFDRDEISAAIKRHGRVARVVIASVQGSSPREVGAYMLVWKDGQSGSIGGGALEFQAAKEARQMSRPTILSQHSLGPDLGQCCGGAVQLLTEIYDARALAGIDKGNMVVRSLRGEADMPLSVQRLMATARATGQAPLAQLIEGWMIEPVTHPKRQLWVWGAGHVGRAFIDVMAPLNDLAITWIDTDLARFPAKIARGVAHTAAKNPVDLIAHAPIDAEHLIVTYSHALDLELCHALLGHGFGYAGLIGSKSKWARFKNRLAALGHGTAQIDRITCPIGTPAFGKHPQVIAIGVAAEILRSTLNRSGSNDQIKENYA